jgi:hypothetical protein
MRGLRERVILSSVTPGTEGQQAGRHVYALRLWLLEKTDEYQHCLPGIVNRLKSRAFGK